MIAQLRGVLSSKSSEYVIIDAGGVGYGVHIPLSTYYQLPQVGETAKLSIYTHVREDAIVLYGFWEKNEKDLFTQLISASKIGPRLACNILSGLPAAEIRKAIVSANSATLSSIPGVGRKTAERIIMELQDKMLAGKGAEEFLAETGEMYFQEAVSAMVNLGYKLDASQNAVRRASKEGRSNSLEELIRSALRLL